MTSQFQVSAKSNAGNIYVVGGESFDDFYGNLNALYEGDLSAVAASLSEFRAILLPLASEGQQLHQAATTVHQGFSQPQARPAPQQRPSPPGQQAPLCEHGVVREYKAGDKNGKAWAAWFCQGTRERSEQCPPQWVRNS